MKSNFSVSSRSINWSRQLGRAAQALVIFFERLRSAVVDVEASVKPFNTFGHFQELDRGEGGRPSAVLSDGSQRRHSGKSVQLEPLAPPCAHFRGALRLRIFGLTPLRPGPGEWPPLHPQHAPSPTGWRASGY